MQKLCEDTGPSHLTTVHNTPVSQLPAPLYQGQGLGLRQGKGQGLGLRQGKGQGQGLPDLNWRL